MRRHLWEPVLLCLLLAGAADAAAPVDEVVVQGSRSKPAELRRQIVELEDRFYERYNALTSVPDFVVHCGREARTGTLMERRHCRAVFEERAFAQEGMEALQYRQFFQDALTAGDPAPVVSGGAPVQAIVAIEARRPAFRRHIDNVVRGDPELMRLLQQRHDLERRYREERRGASASK